MIVFDARNIISFDKFTTFIYHHKNLFEKNRKELFDEYLILKPIAWDENIEKYQAFRESYNNLVLNIVFDVINFYRHLLPKSMLITLFGSLIKKTDRIFSDVDFTICYDESKTEKYECVEELIDYSIVTILGMTIDHVHGNFQHYPEIKEFTKLHPEDNLYRIMFDNNYVEYKCGPETFTENLTNIKNVRDYNSLIMNFKKKYRQRKNSDCLYSIEIFENSTNHDLIKDLQQLENEYDIFDGYVFHLENSILADVFKISTLKIILKHDGIVEFYNFIAYLRRYIKISATYSMNINMLWNNNDLILLFGNEYMKRLEKNYVSFLFYWNRIELSLKKRNIALSTRCYKKFSKKEINGFLLEDWDYNTTLDKILSVKNSLSHQIKEGLQIINDRYI